MVEDDICRGFLDVLEELSEVNLSLEEAFVVYAKRLLAPNQATYVAVDTSDPGCQIVGTVSVLLEKKYIHSGGVAAFIEDVAVRKNYQGEGVGQALVEYAVEVCRKAHAYKVVLDCDDDLISFYSSCNFYRDGNAMRRDI
jgi:glucosamine-phosphate N-acetyltransferase